MISAATTNPPPADPAPLDGYAAAGLVLAGILVVLYTALRAKRRREWPDVADIISVVATSTGVIAGARLVVVAVTADDLGPFRGEDRIFIPLAGVALIAVAARLIYSTIRAGIDP